jgi:hypothetical protein
MIKMLVAACIAPIRVLNSISDQNGKQWARQSAACENQNGED